MAIFKPKRKNNINNLNLSAPYNYLPPVSPAANNFTKKNILFFYLWEFSKMIVISLAIILPIRYFLFQPFYVKGASMEPSFYDHEYLIINEISYRFQPPKRGEVVVFHYPLNPKEYFIKRIIGLPGERIKIYNNSITVYPAGSGQGQILQEPYLTSSEKTLGNVDIQLTADEIYVLGDNRSYSLDSRRFGPINKHAIVGKAWFRGWPLERLGIFDSPQYNFN